ncbi:MAG: hypothetical protein WBV82_25725, partial [Myxococcaceae bacterium]
MLKIQTACAAFAAASILFAAGCGTGTNNESGTGDELHTGPAAPGTSPATPGKGTTVPGTGTTPEPSTGDTEPETGETTPTTGERAGALDKEGLTKMYADDPAQAEQQWFLSEAPPLDSGDFRIGGKGTVENLGDGVY